MADRIDKIIGAMEAIQLAAEAPVARGARPNAAEKKKAKKKQAQAAGALKPA